MADRLDEDRLRAIVASQIRGALGYDSDQLSGMRADNIARYEGEPYGNEVEGQSQVMSRDVMETVEAVMPSLVRTFLQSDQVFTFEPEGPEDDEYADQATDYVNFCLMRDNDGFRIGQDWMKSALITNTSVVKVWWDEADHVKEENYSGLGEEEFIALVEDDDVEVLEHSAYAEAGGELAEPEDAMMAGMMGAPVRAVHDVKIRRKTVKKRLRWEAVPPEEFLVNRRARSLSLDDSTFYFCCHRQARSVEELIADGFDEEKVRRASEHDDWYLEEAEERNDDLEYTDESYSETDESQRRIWVYECYLKVDWDGDGVSELRRVTVLGGGTNTEILENESTEELPFADLCAVRLPYRFYGYALADLVKDIQELKTALWRVMMNGLYVSLYPQRAVNQGSVELDDLLSLEPGGMIRTDGPPAQHIMELTTSWNGAQAFPMMQYIDQILASRSGVNDLAGGLDGSVLQGETARAVDEAANSARARVELMVRNMAEGWRKLAKLALITLNRHQDRERVIRLRNEWVPVDPRSWNVDMDVRVSIGLGLATKSEQAQRYGFIAQKQEQIMAQMGPTNPLAPLDRYYETLKKLAEAADLNAEDHFTDPTEWVEQQRQQPPQPNPEAMKAQAELQMKQQESQAKLQQAQAEAQMRAQTDQRKAELDAEIARFKAEMDAQQQRENAELRAAVDREIASNKLALERDRMNLEHQYRMQELAAEAELEAAKMRAGSRDGQGNIDVSD